MPDVFKCFRVVLGAGFLFFCLVFLPLKWHATCFGRGMDGIQAIHASNAAVKEPVFQKTALVDSSAPWTTILAQEQALAQKYFATTERVTASTASATKPASVELPPLRTSFRAMQVTPELSVDEPIEPSARKKLGGVETLPVETFATQEEFLKMARVSFDAAQQKWSATWEKPQVFHFGMLLKPALVERMEPGSSYTFQSHGMQATLTRTVNDQLVLQRGHETIDLTASSLRDLLHDKISVNGVQLFLDRRGNLVMEARGQKALSLSSSTRL